MKPDDATKLANQKHTIQMLEVQVSDLARAADAHVRRADRVREVLARAKAWMEVQRGK